MTGNIKAQILQIKDLKVVFFYSLNHDFKSTTSTDLLGLNVVYGDNESLNLDYTSPYFDDFVLKVLEVYEKEKSQNNIVLLNELTEKLLRNYNLKEIVGNNGEEQTFYQDKTIFELASRGKETEMAIDYIKDIVINMKTLFFGEDEVVFGNIKGYRNKYFIPCKVRNSEKLIPFSIKKTGNKDFIFKLCGINESPIIVNGLVSIDGGIVKISWNVDDTHLVGQEIFKYDNLHERSIYSLGEIVDFDNEVVPIPVEDKNIIDNYFNILGFEKMTNGMMIGDDRFILGHNEIDTEDSISTEESAHVLLGDDFVSIILSKKNGLAKYDNELIVPISEEREEVSIIPMTLDNNNYLLVQRHYVPTGKMRGEYQNRSDKNSYQFFKINKIDSLREFQGVLDEYQIRKCVGSVDDIKKYIKKGESI